MVYLCNTLIILEVLKAKIGDREVAVKRYKASAKRQLIYEACIMSYVFLYLINLTTSGLFLEDVNRPEGSLLCLLK